jgi:hypothetical protein
MLMAMMGGNKPTSAPVAVPPKKLDTALLSQQLAPKASGGGTDLAKYKKMQTCGLPQGAIEHAMRKDGVDPELMF